MNLIIFIPIAASIFLIIIDIKNIFSRRKHIPFPISGGLGNPKQHRKEGEVSMLTLLRKTIQMVKTIFQVDFDDKVERKKLEQSYYTLVRGIY